MKVAKEAMRLYVVTDRSWLGTQSLAAQVEDTLKAGATFVQLREKSMDSAEMLEEAKELKALCGRYGVPFVVNDDVQVALDCGADGVHVGQEDMACAKARALLGPDKIVGVSAHTVEEALAAQRDGADYIGVGAVFGTTTKLDADTLPRKVVEDICQAVSIPVVAIGGISQENLLELAGSGVDGVAVISAIFAKPDIYAAAKTLRELSDRMVQG